jgi:hypothetical protein
MQSDKTASYVLLLTVVNHKWLVMLIAAQLNGCSSLLINAYNLMIRMLVLAISNFILINDVLNVATIHV